MSSRRSKRHFGSIPNTYHIRMHWRKPLRCLRISPVDNTLCIRLFPRKRCNSRTHTHCAAMQLWFCI
jgi:hypothetical protein